MGKKIIIKGADFSINGMQDESMYTLLNWIGIASTATSFYNSGYKPKANTRVEATLSVDTTKYSSVSYNRVVGSGAQIYGRFFLSIASATSSQAYVGNGQPSPLSSSSYFDGLPHIFIISKDGYKIDESELKTTGDRTFIETEFPFGLNAALDSMSACKTYAWKSATDTPVKVHKVTFYEDDAIVHNFIPVMIKASGEICFYDTITGNYISSNDGTQPLYG